MENDRQGEILETDVVEACWLGLQIESETKDSKLSQLGCRPRSGGVIS
jgi:hypothetical protein